MTEQQPFEVVREYDDFELRRYPEHVLAHVDVEGDFLSAGNLAFRPLVTYIGGRNATSQNIPMTAPVIQEPRGGRTHRVSFVLPEGMDASSVPAPVDARVSTSVVAPHTVAARRFGGGWKESRFDENGDRLLEAVGREGLEVVGGLYFARYDPPWKPGFLKHNEALVAIAG